MNVWTIHSNTFRPSVAFSALTPKEVKGDWVWGVSMTMQEEEFKLEVTGFGKAKGTNIKTRNEDEKNP